MKKVLLIALLAVTFIGVKAQHKIESPHPDLKFELRRAVESNGTVVVDMIVTNLGKDEEVEFSVGPQSSSLIYDDEGNEYKKDVRIGNPSVELRRYPKLLLSREVPVKLRIEVDDVDPYATALTLIKIEMTSRGAMRLTANKPLVIRNVELSKQ